MALPFAQGADDITQGQQASIDVDTLSQALALSLGALCSLTASQIHLQTCPEAQFSANVIFQPALQLSLFEMIAQRKAIAYRIYIGLAKG